MRPASATSGSWTATPAEKVELYLTWGEPPAEVQDAVRDAASLQETVRVVATGHSCTPVHLTEGTMIDLDRLNQLVDELEVSEIARKPDR